MNVIAFDFLKLKNSDVNRTKIACVQFRNFNGIEI